jgi:flagellin-like protein
MKITNAQKRKAISPVIATVILIAITLIAAIAIAGFVFGLFGSFTSTAQVLVSSVSCTAAAQPVCTLTLSNSGTANTAVVASTFTLTYGGVKYGGSCATAVIITAGAAAAVSCTATASGTPSAVAGEQFTGSLGLSNGGVVSFSGTF